VSTGSEYVVLGSAAESRGTTRETPNGSVLDGVLSGVPAGVAEGEPAGVGVKGVEVCVGDTVPSTGAVDGAGVGDDEPSSLPLVGSAGGASVDSGATGVPASVVGNPMLGAEVSAGAGCVVGERGVGSVDPGTGKGVLSAGRIVGVVVPGACGSTSRRA